MGAVACGRMVEDHIQNMNQAEPQAQAQAQLQPQAQPQPQQQPLQQHQHIKPPASPITHTSKRSDGEGTYRMEKTLKRHSASFPCAPHSHPSGCETRTSVAVAHSRHATETGPLPLAHIDTRTHRHARSMYLSDRPKSSKYAHMNSVPTSPANRIRSLSFRPEPNVDRMTSPRTALALMRMGSPRSSVGSIGEGSSVFSVYVNESGQCSPLVIGSVSPSPVASPVSMQRRLTPSGPHPLSQPPTFAPKRFDEFPTVETTGSLLIDTSRDSPDIPIDAEPVNVIVQPENALDLMSMNLEVDVDSILVDGESPFFS